MGWQGRPPDSVVERSRPRDASDRPPCERRVRWALAVREKSRGGSDPTVPADLPALLLRAAVDTPPRDPAAADRALITDATARSVATASRSCRRSRSSPNSCSDPTLRGRGDRRAQRLDAEFDGLSLRHAAEAAPISGQPTKAIVAFGGGARFGHGELPGDEQ